MRLLHTSSGERLVGLLTTVLSEAKVPEKLFGFKPRQIAFDCIYMMSNTDKDRLVATIRKEVAGWEDGH